MLLIIATSKPGHHACNYSQLSLHCCAQVRGSIPLYWNQEGVTHLKPDITLQHYDPLYSATRLHFEVTVQACNRVFWLYSTAVGVSTVYTAFLLCKTCSEQTYWA